MNNSGIRKNLFLISSLVLSIASFAGDNTRLDNLLSQPISGLSQSEGYLRTLGQTRQEIFDKIKKVLSAPRVSPGKPWDVSDLKNYDSADASLFVDNITDAIVTEQKNPDYYFLYHSAQKAGIILALLRTYMDMHQNNWFRDDFLILRSKKFIYPRSAKSSLDYIQQNYQTNTSNITNKQTKNFLKENKVNITKQIYSIKNKNIQFDFISPYRDHLISVSPAIIAGVDGTQQEKRGLYDMDFAAWESSFYYFAAELSWSNINRLYDFLISDLKDYDSTLFNKGEDAESIRKFLALSFSEIIDKVDKVEPKAGMMVQYMIPKDLIDDVAYLAYANGIVWQRKIPGIQKGWNYKLGTYTRISPVLDVLKQDPKSLGPAVHLLQARIVLKDLEHFYDPQSRIKMNIINNLPSKMFSDIKNVINNVAETIVSYKNKAVSKDVKQFISQSEQEISRLVNSKDRADVIHGLTILLYYAKSGIKHKIMDSLEFKFKATLDTKIDGLVSSILKSVDQIK